MIAAIIGGTIAGLAVNETCDVSPWLARWLVRWSASVRYSDPHRAEVRAEELATVIDQRPGNLLKLSTGLCFAASAVTSRCLNGDRERAGLIARLAYGGILVWLGTSAIVAAVVDSAGYGPKFADPAYYAILGLCAVGFAAAIASGRTHLTLLPYLVASADCVAFYNGDVMRIVSATAAFGAFGHAGVRWPCRRTRARYRLAV